MRKLFLYSLLLSSTLALSACGKSDKSDVDKDTSSDVIVDDSEDLEDNDEEFVPSLVELNDSDSSLECLTKIWNAYPDEYKTVIQSDIPFDVTDKDYVKESLVFPMNKFDSIINMSAMISDDASKDFKVYAIRLKYSLEDITSISDYFMDDKNWGSDIPDIRYISISEFDDGESVVYFASGSEIEMIRFYDFMQEKVGVEDVEYKESGVEE